jgi:hypothetical protein
MVALTPRNLGRSTTRLEYRLNGHALKPIHDWAKDYERSWSDRRDELDVVDELKTKEEEAHGSDD